MKNFLLSFLALGAIASLAAAPISYQVSVDTSAIPNATAGLIEFQFNQANGNTSLAATATVSGFTASGFTFDSMLDYSLGGVSGSLASLPIVFDNTVGGTNLYDGGVGSFGSGFSFILTLDGDALSNTANDGSGFFVYLLATDLSNLLGPDGTLAASLAINGDTTITTNGVNNLSTIEPYTPPSVPEPSAFVLLGTGAAMLFARRSVRLFRRG